MPMFDFDLVTKATTTNCPLRTLRPRLRSTTDRQRTRPAVCVRIFAAVFRRFVSFAPSSAPDVAATRGRQPTNPAFKPARTMRDRSSLFIERTVNNIHFQIAPVVLRQRIVPSLPFILRIDDSRRKLLLAAHLPPVT